MFVAVIRDLLYADDCDLISHSERGLQILADCFVAACDVFGFSVNIPKTKVMLKPSPGNPFIKPAIVIKSKILDVVKTFVYLGKSVSQKVALVSEISARIQKASKAVGDFADRVWNHHNINYT